MYIEDSFVTAGVFLSADDRLLVNDLFFLVGLTLIMHTSGDFEYFVSQTLILD